jgi:hypothetical protein
MSGRIHPSVQAAVAAVEPESDLLVARPDEPPTAVV